MQIKRCQLLLRPRNDICRPSIHSKVAALHREQHTGGSKPARRVLVDEEPSTVPARSHGRSAACSRRRRAAEARTAAATRQRCAGGGAHRPHGFSHEKVISRKKVGTLFSSHISVLPGFAPKGHPQCGSGDACAHGPEVNSDEDNDSAPIAGRIEPVWKPGAASGTRSGNRRAVLSPRARLFARMPIR